MPTTEHRPIDGGTSIAFFITRIILPVGMESKSSVRERGSPQGSVQVADGGSSSSGQQQRPRFFARSVSASTTTRRSSLGSTVQVPLAYFCTRRLFWCLCTIQQCTCCGYVVITACCCSAAVAGRFICTTETNINIRGPPALLLSFLSSYHSSRAKTLLVQRHS